MSTNLTKSKTNRVRGRLQRLVNECMSSMSVYERGTSESILSQLKNGHLVTFSQKLFVDQLYKKLRPAMISCGDPACIESKYCPETGSLTGTREPE